VKPGLCVLTSKAETTGEGGDVKRVLTFVVFLVVLWLLLGAFAAFDSGYFDDQDCATALDDAQMVAWGPLSYVQTLEFSPGQCIRPD
jgi:hypothetical protein